MKKLLSCLLVLSMIASMFVAVTAETNQSGANVRSTSYDICTDENGNPLNPYFVNGNIWTEADGAIKPAEGPIENFLLFDNGLATKRVEATFNLTLNGDKDTRNGIVFALTDHDNDNAFIWDADVSYYWAFISGWDGRIGVLKMGKYNGWTQLSAGGDWGKVGPTFAELGINPADGVTLAAEWDNEGHIKVFANGTLVHDITDTTGTPLTGNLYGLFMRDWSNSADGGHSLTYNVSSFVTGDAKLAINATAGEGGTVTGGADNFYRGQSATVTATVNEGYNFVGWYENDVLVSSDPAYTFKVTGNRDLVAKFTKDAYTITATPDGNGTVEGAGEYGEGSSATLTATPEAGYRFVGWYENGTSVSTDKAYTFTVSADRTLTAKFEKITSYPIAVDGDGNVLNPYFVNGNIWSEESGGAIKPAPGAMENFILFDNELATNRVEATFRDLPHNYDGDTRNGIVFALTDINDDHATGINDGGASYWFACVSGYGEVQLIEFPGWKNYTTGGSVDLSKDVTLAVEWDANGNIRVFANGELRIEKKLDGFIAGNLYGVLMRSWANTEGGGYSHAHTVTSFIAGGALAIPDTEVKVTVDPTDAGIVTGAGNYHINSMATLTATANTGYTFVGWYDGEELKSADATYTFKVTEACNLTAKFTKNTYTVTVTPEGNGTATGGGEYGEGASATVTATANTGYKFVGWFDGTTKVSSDAAYTFTVEANVELTAKFEKVTYTVPVDDEGNALNPYFVNGVTWVEEDGKLKMPAGPAFSFLLFDNELAINRVEAKFENMTLSGSRDDRNGIVFALTDIQGDATVNEYWDTDFSYYWAFISGENYLELVEMGAGENWKFFKSVLLSDLDIDVTADGITLAVEWDANGNIKVFANGILAIDVVDETPLTGDLYGTLVRRWGNSQDGNTDYTDTITSFIAGGELETPDIKVNVTVDPTVGGTTAGAGNYYLGQSVTLKATANDGYKFIGWFNGETKVSEEAEYTLTAEANCTLTAKFEKLHTCEEGTKVDGQGATCDVDGWNDYYKCSCGKLYSDADCTNEITDLDAWKKGDGKIAAGHTYGTLVEEDPGKHTATELKDGMKAHYFCDGCDTYFTAEKVATTKEALTIKNAHAYGTEWGYKGTDGHSHVCECGAKEEVLAHTPNITAPTETEDQVCTACQYVIANKLGHVHKDNLTEVKAKDADCTTDGNKAYYTCSCGKWFTDNTAATEITDKNSVVIKAGHTYGALVEADPGKHTATELKDGMKAHYFCDKCDKYFTAEKVETTKEALTIKNAHAYGTEWGYKGADGHAHVCECGAKDTVLAHTPNIAAPTETEDQVCTACQYVIAEKLSHVHKDNLTEVKAKDADCTTDGNKAYYTCSCGKWFTDNTAATEITDKNSVVIKAGHTYGELVKEVPAVHTEAELKAGMKAHYFCDKCDTYFTAEKAATTKEALVIAAPTHSFGTEWGYKGADGHAHVCECGAKDTVANHTPNIAAPTETEDQKCTACGYVIAEKLSHVHKDNLTEVKAKDADCTNDGNKAYYTCSCGKWFTDNTAATEITDKNSVVIKGGHIYGELVKEVPAVHTEAELKAGMKAHYFCDKCDKYFTAEKVETTKEALVIAAPTHVDANNDGKCDGCDYNTNPDTPDVPQTGDNTLWICLAVVLLSGFAVIGKSLYTQKKRRVED